MCSRVRHIFTLQLYCLVYCIVLVVQSQLLLFQFHRLLLHMIVVWSAASKCVHHLCCCCWHSFFLSVFLPFSLKYPLSICCKSGPFSLQGSLKLHLVTSTPTLTFFHFPPRRLIFLQTLPEVFLPRGSFFIPSLRLHCGVSILSLVQRKQYRRLERERTGERLLWASDADVHPKTFCFQLFIFLWTFLCLYGGCREWPLKGLKWWTESTTANNSKQPEARRGTQAHTHY